MLKYQEILPCPQLGYYVKCYYLFESDSELHDTVFPGGYMEIIFNLGEGIWKTRHNNVFHKTPRVELWGQLTKPLAVQTTGRNAMLGIRFYPHSASCFLNEEAWQFNDRISDVRDVLGMSVNSLHEKLMNEPELKNRVELLESFLLKRLSIAENRSHRMSMVSTIVNELKQPATSTTVENIARRYDITPRYLQKLFLNHTGVTPKLFARINRFQNSLKLISKRETSLTSVAHDSGYFDQSHFIREFKSFTGFAPSAYSAEKFPVGQVLNNN